MKKLLSCGLTFFCLWLGMVGSAAATQTEVSDVDAVTRVVESISNPEIDYNEMNSDLDKTENELKSRKVTGQELSAAVKFLSDNRSKIDEVKKQVEKELNFVQKKIDALGPAPAEGTTEPAIIAEKRSEFNRELNFQKSKMAEADILLARIDELDNLIITVRNKKLLGSLLDRQSSLINPTVFWDSTEEFVDFGVDILKSPVNWFAELNTEGRDFVKTNVIPVIIIFLFSLWLGIYLRLFIMRHFGYRQDLEHIRYGQKVIAAICVAVGYGVIPAFILGSLLVWLVSNEVMTVGFFGLVLNSFLYFALYVILIRAVARVIFAPYNEKWRLVNISNDKAKRITKALYFSAYSIGIASFLEHVAVTANYGLELNYFITVLSSAVKAFCIILIVKRVIWDDEMVQDDIADETSETEEDEGLSPAFKITFFVSLFAAGVFLIAVVGYPKLSAFILDRSILTAIVIGFFIVLRKALSEVMHRVLMLRFWVKTFKMRRRMLSKIDFWMSLIIDPMLVLLVAFVLLSLWGVSTDLLLRSIKKLFFGFQVGGVNISLIAIIFAILAFLISLAAVKALRGRLVNNVLSKMDIDDGIKHSLSSGFSFVCFILAAIIAITVIGGNLSNLALIASALSVGIGFGLQNVINNFVSGIIILFERPFKVGDWVIVNNEEGRIKQINIRSTEIETFKKTSIIIPNATLISNSVTNLTHGNNWSRQSVTVGVAYGTDVDKVKQILLECAAKCKYVLKNPAPYVLFKDFGPSSLDFEVRCYTNDIWNGWIIPSDLRTEINKRFIEEGIEIPFQQMVIHQGEKVAPVEQFYAKRKVKKEEK